MKTLNPVILPVPEDDRDLPAKQRTVHLSRYARKALFMSAHISRAALGPLHKDEDGAPLPSNGYFWSITHKPKFVGGVVSDLPVGMDLEEIRPCSPGLFKKVAVKEEWALSDMDPVVTFFRYWTAKESLIKLRGTGIRDMLKCRVIDIPDAGVLTIRCEGRRYSIEHRYFSGHVASIVKDHRPVCWQV